MTADAIHLLLLEAFPNADNLPDDCWARRALARAPHPWDDVASIVSVAGARNQLIGRLTGEHPVDRAHHPAHDAGLRRLFTEAEALAWAVEEGELGVPAWIEVPAAPLRVEAGATRRIFNVTERPVGVGTSQALPFEDDCFGRIRRPASSSGGWICLTDRSRGFPPYDRGGTPLSWVTGTRRARPRVRLSSSPLETYWYALLSLIASALATSFIVSKTRSAKEHLLAILGAIVLPRAPPQEG